MTRHRKDLRPPTGDTSGDILAEQPPVARDWVAASSRGANPHATPPSNNWRPRGAVVGDRAEPSLDRRTVRRFARATDVEELLTAAQTRATLLDACKPHLHERFNAGCTDAARLTREIIEVGYRGSDKPTTPCRPQGSRPRSGRPPAGGPPTGAVHRRRTRTALRPPGTQSCLTTDRELVHDLAEIMDRPPRVDPPPRWPLSTLTGNRH